MTQAVATSPASARSFDPPRSACGAPPQGGDRRGPGAAGATAVARGQRRGLLLGAVGAVACVGLPRFALAAASVRWLHIEQNPAAVAFYKGMAQRFEAAHAGVRVELQYLENDAYKKKLTTLLQSPERPHILYSWAGGVLREQVKAGVVEDLTEAAGKGGWRSRYSASALNAYSVEGKLYGLPVLSTQVGFFYNLALFDKAGVKADNIKTWDDFIAAVKALQAAGITPLLAGGGDKWPLHFYWSHLALRIGGRAAFEAAMATRGGGAAAADSGFAGPLFVQAGERFKQLADLKPFQAGYIAASHPQSAGQFADGKGAMMLMMDGVRNTMRANASDKQGIPDSQLGWFPFPTVAGGRGSADETLGGMNGWLVTKGAPPEAAAFVGFMGEVANQRIAAQQGFYIPAALGTADAIAQPILRRIADNVARSPYHQLFYDQMLGPAVGAVVNDISADLTSGRITPAAAASKVQQAWLRAR